VVQQWVKEQAQYAQRQLESLPGRSELLARIVELDAGTPYSLSSFTRMPNGDLFYFKQAARENVAKVYVRDARTGAEQRLLYGFAVSGSEETTLKVFDRATGRDLPDAIDRIESEYALPYWLPDGESFVYSRRRKVAPNAPPTDGYKFTQAFQHTLGRDPEQADRPRLARTRRRAGDRARSRRRSVWKGVASRGPQAYEAQHMEGLCGLRRVSCERALHEPREAVRARRKCRGDFDRASDYGTSRPLCRRSHFRRLHRHVAFRDDDE